MKQSQPLLHRWDIPPQLPNRYAAPRMRGVGIGMGVVRVGLPVVLAVLFSAGSVFAGTQTTFQLPAVQVTGCTAIDGCTMQARPVSGSSGTFTINMTSSGPPVEQVLGPGQDKSCFPLAGTATLDFGSGDVLALGSKAAGDTVCISQNLDQNFIPVPQAGPWPVVMTVFVDGAASSGIYAGAAGGGSITGTWIVDPNDPFASPGCLDSLGDPIGQCGFSGEHIVLTFNTASIPDLTLATGGGGCTIDCGGGNPGATPELDSLVLFGSALVSFGGYVVIRRRAHRRQD